MPGSPWENGYVESFQCRLKQFLEGEIFDTLKQAQITNQTVAGALQHGQAA